MSDNYVLSIGRQLGAGGAVIGQLVAERFGFRYIDREILVLAAEELEVSEKALGMIEERALSLWHGFTKSNVFDMHSVPQEWYLPTGKKLFDTQTEILKDVAEKDSCVFVGRCATHIFKGNPKHVSVFLHADMETRKKRIEESGTLALFGDSPEKAIIKEDKDRARYFKNFTGQDWLDLTFYDLAINTGIMSYEKAADIICDYMTERFPELKK